MSQYVKLWLRLIGREKDFPSHEDRVAFDNFLSEKFGENCDEVIKDGKVSMLEFSLLCQEYLRKKKKNLTEQFIS